MKPLNRIRHLAIPTICLAVALASGLSSAAEYTHGPDSFEQAGVPKGTLTEHEWTSEIFTGTHRKFWVYLPQQLDRSKPAPFMVWQDGAVRIDPKRNARVPIVYDNLIHKGDIPPMIGIFIDPGVFPALPESNRARRNRGFEYNTLSDQYVRFLLEEILPEVERIHNLTLTTDPEGRGISGYSSGAICAFTAAWERPDAFRKVLSGIGSYVGIAYRPANGNEPMRPGGDLYPTLIRKNPIKPLKIFLQDGSNDLNNEHGNWFQANQQMLSALEWANANADEKNLPGPRYQVKHVWGTLGHETLHIGTLIPDALRWLWSGYQPNP